MQSPLGARIDDPLTGQPAAANTFRFAEVVGEYVARHVLDASAKGPALPVSAIEYREKIVESRSATRAT